MNITVIGAGLAGSECAWQLARRGVQVTLCEMKPEKRTPAHTTDNFAELCCSNSLRSDQLENAVGLLKEELRQLNSLILQCAEATRVEAGGALAGGHSIADSDVKYGLSVTGIVHPEKFYRNDSGRFRKLL